MSAKYLAHQFRAGEIEAPASDGTARLMPVTFKNGKAASMTRGVVHIVRAAAIATDGKSATTAARWECGGGSVNAVPVVTDAPHVSCANCVEAVRYPHGPVVYRCYDAEDGELIYIGSSIDVFTRIRAHRRATRWFDEVGEIKCEAYPTESAARLAEAQAITRERPYYNRLGVPTEDTATA